MTAHDLPHRTGALAHDLQERARHARDRSGSRSVRPATALVRRRSGFVPRCAQRRTSTWSAIRRSATCRSLAHHGPGPSPVSRSRACIRTGTRRTDQ